MSAILSLPQHLSFQDLSRELQRTFRTAGGWRSVEDAMKLYEQVPASYRTSIDKVAEWMKGRDGSHIIPKSAGGSDKPFNIVLERHLDNIRRGAKPMTRAEQFGIWVEGFSANLGQAALQGLQKDILCKWLPKKTKELQAVEETIQQARALEAKEKFGLSFWLQWTGITTVAGFVSLLGTTSILGDLGSSTVGLYSLLSMVLSIGFAQWMLMKVRTGSGIQSLLIKLLAEVLKES